MNNINNVKEKTKEPQFNNEREELAYYKTKYYKNKEKYRTYKDLQDKLRKEHTDLSIKYETGLEELAKEKAIRKKFEEKTKDLMKFENVSPNIHDQFRINVGSDLSKIGDNGDLFRQSSNNFGSSASFDRASEIQDNIQIDSNMNSSNLKEKTLKEITDKFDTEKLKKSLTIDFLDYERDNIAIRRKLVMKEERIIKLEKILKVWTEITGSLKKSADGFINSMVFLNENLIQDLDVFEECPDLISLIYTLQGVLGDMINQFRFFSASIEHSFLNQIKNFLQANITDLKETRQSLIKYTDEFNYCCLKFLNTKKSAIKDSMKDSYYSAYKLCEFTRYDYINKINLSLIFTKVDLPEKVSLLIYAFMVSKY